MGRFASRRTRLAAALFGAALIVPSTGCIHKILATVVYAINGSDVPADYPGLKKQRVLVLCRPPSTLEYRYGGADRELVRAVNDMLVTNMKKNIDLVPEDMIEDWTDQRDWEFDDLDELARDCKADKIVLIDLEQFNLLKGPTLYQGRADVQLKVMDMKDNGRVVFQRSLPEVLFPVNGAVPAQEQELVHFRRQYINILANKIARHFYPHDKNGDFAIDSSAYN